MPILDKKKCQHLIDRIAEEVVLLKAIGIRLAALRTAYQDQSVDATGTPLDGHVATVSNWIDDIVTAGNNAVANGFIANASIRHRRPSALGEGL